MTIMMMKYELPNVLVELPSEINPVSLEITLTREWFDILYRSSEFYHWCVEEFDYLPMLRTHTAMAFMNENDAMKFRLRWL